jgi:hypothetical protein
MFLKKDINMNEFLKTVDKCEGDVYFISAEDELDLKSSLCRYIIGVKAANNNIDTNTKIQCKYEKDYLVLDDFLIAQ